MTHRASKDYLKVSHLPLTHWLLPCWSAYAHVLKCFHFMPMLAFSEPGIWQTRCLHFGSLRDHGAIQTWNSADLKKMSAPKLDSFSCTLGQQSCISVCFDVTKNMLLRSGRRCLVKQASISIDRNSKPTFTEVETLRMAGFTFCDFPCRQNIF